MSGILKRVGTTYIPVMNVRESVDWYIDHLGAKLNYQDQNKAIIDLAGQSFFLVKASDNENSNFMDAEGNKRFSQTFEVDGVEELFIFNKQLKDAGVEVGKVENRGHPGRNFTFNDLNGNSFDVWSELSPSYNRRGNE
ncbi:VOC family protein [Halobacillus mangrovi]|uniref:VOC family protein n=1 Tax=Halobacillus mangrovi TaxID=402384 RepID=UPI0012F4FF2A|nr:VOC family protein [Halobacillus mangrovi]